jgi:hypothetical protein
MAVTAFYLRKLQSSASGDVAITLLAMTNACRDIRNTIDESEKTLQEGRKALAKAHECLAKGENGEDSE